MNQSILKLPETYNSATDAEKLSAYIIQLEAKALKAEKDLRDYDETHKGLILGAKKFFRELWSLTKKNNEYVEALNKLKRENEKQRKRHKRRYAWLLRKYLALKAKKIKPCPECKGFKSVGAGKNCKTCDYKDKYSPDACAVCKCSTCDGQGVVTHDN
jgi:hypothetical protein